jgi:iduronate 2-sulfatase
MWAAYYAAITFMDEQVGRIMTELDRLGLRESTAVVFISDHGYHLGDHTFWQKANLHEEVIRVPMIVSVPGMKSGCSDSVVELVDLYPTISELVGLAVPKASQGRSLVPVLKDPDTAIKAGAVSFVSKGASWRTRDWAYMRYKDGSEELYDMRKDPGQITNLAGYPEYVSQLKKMAAELNGRL